MTPGWNNLRFSPCGIPLTFLVFGAKEGLRVSGSNTVCQWIADGCQTSRAVPPVQSLQGEEYCTGLIPPAFTYAFSFQGYESSLLKVTSKNGKTSSVSVI